MARVSQPYRDTQELEASQLNANLYRWYPVTADTEAELNEFLTSHTVGGQTYPGVPIGTMGYRTDNEAVYEVNASRQWEYRGSWETFREIARPNLDFHSSAGVLQGRVTMSLTAGTTGLLVEAADGTDAFRLSYNPAAGAGVARLQTQAFHASGQQLSSLNVAYHLLVSDTETRVAAATNLKLKAQTLQLEDETGGTGLAPLLSLGGAAAPPTSLVGTNADGRIVALPQSDYLGGGGGGSGGMVVTDVVSYRSYSAATTATNSNESADVDLPEGWETGQGWVYIEAAVSVSGNIRKGTALLSVSDLLGVDSAGDDVGSVSLPGVDDPARVFFTNDTTPGARDVTLQVIASGQSPRILQVSTIGTGRVGNAYTRTLIPASTAYAAATAGTVTETNAVVLPTDFREFDEVRIRATTSGGLNFYEALPTSVFPTSGSDYVAIDFLTNTFRINFNPSTRQVELSTTGQASPRFTFFQLVVYGVTTLADVPEDFTDLDDTPSSLGTAGQQLRMNTAANALEFFTPTAAVGSFVGLSDTPSSLTAGQWLKVNAAGNGLIETAPPEVEGITWILAQFTITSATSSGDQGYSTGIAGSTITDSGEFTYNGTTYTVSEVAQSGTTIDLRISPQTPELIPIGTTSAWRLQIGDTYLDFSAATRSTAPGNRYVYQWTGQTANTIPASGSTIIRIRQPISDIHGRIPTQLSGLGGTLSSNQFADNTIAYTRAIGATTTDQQGWRTKAGFGNLVSESANVTTLPLFYSNNQVIQGRLSLLSLVNVSATRFPTTQEGDQVAMFKTTGLDRVARIALSNLPHSGTAGQILQTTATGWEYITTPTGGSGGASSFANLQGNIALTQLTGVTTVDNRKTFTVAGGVWTIAQLGFDDITGTLPATRLSGNIPAARFGGYSTTEQQAIRTAIGASAGTSATIGFNTVTPGGIQVYTSASTTSSRTFDPQRQANFRRALGINEFSNFHRWAGSLTPGRNLSDEVGYFATSPQVGTITADSGYSGRSFTLDQRYNIEEISVDQTGDDWSLTVVLSEAITSGVMAFVNVGGHSFDFGDATTLGDSNYVSTGQSYEWQYVPADLMENNVAVEISFGGAIEAEIAREIGAIRQLPPLPTSNQTLSYLRGDSTWQQIRTRAQEGRFTYTLSTVSRPDQTTQGPTPTIRTNNADLFSLSGRTITLRKAGLLIANIDATARASNNGTVRVWLQHRNADVENSIFRFGQHDRGQSANYRQVHIPVNSGDWLFLEYVPEDVSPASSTGIPGDISGANGTQYSSGNYTLIQWTGPATSAYDRVHYQTRPSGAGAQNWSEVVTIYDDVNNFRAPWINDTGLDVRWWLEKVGSSGGFSKRATYTHSNDTITNETSRNQIVDAIIDLHIALVEAY